MLQTDLHHAVGLFRRRQTFFRFGNGPGHGFFGVKVFCRREGIHEMPGVNVKGAGNDDAIEVFHVQQTPVIVERLNTGRHLLGCVPPTRIDVRDGYELGV